VAAAAVRKPTWSRRSEAGSTYSTAEVAELFGVARSTVYRAIERERDRALGNDSTLASAILSGW
jgi:transposase